MKKILRIEGMSCGHCVNHVKNALMDIEGVENVEVSLDEKKAIVEGNDLNEEKMKTEIEDFGYTVIEIE
ncbi:copper ion binding protein [Clostridium sediminicola]|uniref:heavy-metal-associated domain-containing protein n=1 Tax=Clostridium sediminicola TaxID=3114879 RepID=UPI0031F1E551